MIAHKPFDLAQHYFDFLKNTRAEVKIDLILKLTQSLKEPLRKKSSLESLFGSLECEESAEEIIARIKEPTPERYIEPL